MKPAILVVEDEEEDFLLLKRAFGRFGSADLLRWVKDGREAEEFLSESRKSPPALIICDLKMPRMDGLELLQTAKGKKELKPIPFVILTSSNLELDRKQAKAFGADLYIVKPDRFEKLVEIAVKIDALARGIKSKDAGDFRLFVQKLCSLPSFKGKKQWPSKLEEDSTCRRPGKPSTNANPNGIGAAYSGKISRACSWLCRRFPAG